jgi:cysteine dioxygenase
MQGPIKSLNQLLNNLKTTTKTEYKSIGATLKIPLEDIRPYAFWSTNHYTRNCIIREANYELILLCWEPGQETPVHCHGGEECWVYIIDGQIEETHFQFDGDELTSESMTKLESGQKSFMDDQIGYHKLVNKTNSRAMSLHLYMDTIDTCTVYDKDLNEFVPRALHYFSYEGILETAEV